METPCPYCDRKCKGPRGLNLHLNKCAKNVTRQTCNFCGRLVNNIQDHISKCKNNPGNNGTICKFCGGYRVDMGAHIDKCEYNPINGKICSFCEKYCLSGIKGHVENCDRNPINQKVPCQFCNLSFRMKFLDKHEQQCDKNPNLKRCPHCPRYITIDTFDDHVLTCQTRQEKIRNNCRRFLSSSRMFSNNNNNNNNDLQDKINDLTNVLSKLAIKLQYEDTESMLEDHDLKCPVCYEPTDKKTVCEHPICAKCLNQIKSTSNNPKCPICRESI